MVHFPEGATVLGAAVKWSSRSAVDLSAHISNAGSAVTIDFAFLDVDDGGIIEILYQGDSEQSPTLTGSIMGAPKGIQTIPRMKLTYGDGPEDDDDEEEGNGWRGWLVPATVLALAAAISAVEVGPAHPLSIVLYTLIAELILAALFSASIGLYFSRRVGSRNFWKNIPPMD